MFSTVETLRSSPIILIKPGTETPPIFIAHGLDGMVLFHRLAEHIRTNHPVYGIQAKGVDGGEPPFDRVEDMADFYLKALEESHPEGPYILIGYSFGGFVALEMAQRLLQQKKDVSLLALVDAYPHPRYLSSALRHRLYVRRWRTHLKQMWELPMPSAFSYFFHRVKNRMLFSSSRSESFQETLASSPREGALKMVKSKAYTALATYEPKFYPGKIKFVTAEAKSFFPEDPAAVWGHLAAELEIDTIPGDHLSIVNKEFKPLAAVLTRYVQELDSVRAK
jgi:thioesterase domain-containing protein